MVLCLLLSAHCPLLYAFTQGQDPAPPDQAAEEDEKPLPGDWAVSLLDKMANSPNPEARDGLMRVAMAVGPPAIPLLESALQDDRTAEFAAQALAFIGGEKALKLLWGLTSDRRDMNLRRFYYGALAEFAAPEATETLLEVIKKADSEPDRTVTETAIVALTVQSDPKVLPALREAGKTIQDVVIRLDLESAMEVIDGRAKRQASGKQKSGGSIEYAIRNYFSPALDSPPPPPQAPARPPAKRAAARGVVAKPPARPSTPPPAADVHIQNVTLSPHQTRALARVIFEDPSATATYDIVLQKQYGDWTVASVWTGTQMEKPLPEPAPRKLGAEN
ncbi:MAG: HEAT repeat domain-containing protein [Acidobacteria bacterium]|nr:HEAT repeat domain-containing protein [Acidobacteriota bacterium]